MTWEELARTLALLGFSSTVVGGAIGFVLKGVVENQFKQNLERFKIQFSKLHEMRASVIAELYGSSWTWSKPFTTGSTRICQSVWRHPRSMS